MSSLDLNAVYRAHNLAEVQRRILERMDPRDPRYPANLVAYHEALDELAEARRAAYRNTGDEP